MIEEPIKSHQIGAPPNASGPEQPQDFTQAASVAEASVTPINIYDDVITLADAAPPIAVGPQAELAAATVATSIAVAPAQIVSQAVVSSAVQNYDESSSDEETDDSAMAPFARLIREPWALLQKYRRTRVAVRAREPLHALTARERRKRNLFGPWAFNLAESTIAAAPTVILIKALEFWWPLEPTFPASTPELAIRTAKNFAPIFNSFQPFFLPVLLLCTAWMFAAASLHGRDNDKQRRKTATSAYLYLDGSLGLIPQFIGGFSVALGLWLAQRDLLPSVAIGCVVLFVYASFHQLYVAGSVIPHRLFELNGYSPKVVHFWTRARNRPPNPAPWSRYNLALFVGAPIFGWGLLIVWFVASYSLAAVLARVQLR